MIATMPEEALGAYVISMSQAASDVLAVRLLQEEAGVRNPMRVVPLFETLDDLVNSTEIMRSLWSMPWYQGDTNKVGLRGLWRVACGVWRVACGVWRVACGVWRVALYFVLHQPSPQPSLTSPTHHLTSHHITSPHLTSPHLTSPHLTSPHLTSPHLTSLTHPPRPVLADTRHASPHDPPPLATTPQAVCSSRGALRHVPAASRWPHRDDRVGGHHAGGRAGGCAGREVARGHGYRGVGWHALLPPLQGAPA